jgi:hypothetical protein
MIMNDPSCRSRQEENEKNEDEQQEEPSVHANHPASPRTSSNLDGSGTSKRCSNSSSRPKDGNQPLDSRPRTHSTTGATSEEVNGVGNGQRPVLEVSTHPALHAAIMSCRDAGVRVEALTREHSAKLGLEAYIQDRGEGVGEVEDEQRADDAGNTVEVGHCGTDNKCQCPVHRTERPPHVFTPLGADLGEVEDFLEDFDVDGLHANVHI